MQALSHFSYHQSGGRYVLCDLQGGFKKGRLVLTDPVILSRDRQYGVTDLGAEGISTFFSRHQCNSFCRSHWQLPRDRKTYFKAFTGTSMMAFGQRDGDRRYAFQLDTTYYEEDEDQGGPGGTDGIAPRDAQSRCWRLVAEHGCQQQ